MGPPHTDYVADAVMATFGKASHEVVFQAALHTLPLPLREALLEGELVDPGLLQAYQRSTVEWLGLTERSPPPSRT